MTLASLSIAAPLVYELSCLKVQHTKKKKVFEKSDIERLWTIERPILRRGH